MIKIQLGLAKRLIFPSGVRHPSVSTIPSVRWDKLNWFDLRKLNCHTTKKQGKIPGSNMILTTNQEIKRNSKQHFLPQILLISCKIIALRLYICYVVIL